MIKEKKERKKKKRKPVVVEYALIKKREKLNFESGMISEGW